MEQGRITTAGACHITGALTLRYITRANHRSLFTLECVMASARKADFAPTVASKKTITREQLIAALNEDLAREYQAVIAYVTYSQVLKGPEYMHIAKDLETHAKEELQHALTIAKQIDYLGGAPTVVPKPVKTSEDAKEMLRADLENERDTIRNYRRRVRQCEELNEIAMAEHIREILRQEQDHLIDLATALGVDVPDPGIA